MSEGWRVDRVVVPVDLSDLSMYAVETALKLAPASGVHVVTVLEPLSAIEPGVIYGTINDADRAARVRATLERTLEERGIRGVHLDVRTGPPGVTICDYAEEISAGLIVVPSHGRTGLRRLLIGSVAEVIVRHATVPVLVLRLPKTET
ncbi:MAG: universal stress protein [Myxococcales bacterium]|nr:universal stress protein [Myxococcales bacterium]